MISQHVNARCSKGCHRGITLYYYVLTIYGLFIELSPSLHTSAVTDGFVYSIILYVTEAAYWYSSGLRHSEALSTQLSWFPFISKALSTEMSWCPFISEALITQLSWCPIHQGPWELNSVTEFIWTQILHSIICGEILQRWMD